MKVSNELEKARLYINKVKDLEPDYNIYPEFLDTEATVWLMTFRETKDEEFLEQARQKIIAAINIDPLDPEYLSTFNAIKDFAA